MKITKAMRTLCLRICNGGQPQPNEYGMGGCMEADLIVWPEGYDRFTLTEAGTKVAREEEALLAAQRARRNASRRGRDDAMRSLGLTKVRGNLGGTYWE